jgi:hypothetical protein
MRILLVFLLKIVFFPFRWLYGVLYRKHATIRLQITYGSGKAYITSQYESDQQEFKYLIITYILFLSRYFFICEERQTKPVSSRLAEYIKRAGSGDQLAGILLETVHATLNQKEKGAVVGLFSFRNLPPLTYTEGTNTGAKMAQYTLTTYKRGDRWSIDFYMSAGPDIILLPITVGILYEYVSDKIGAEYRAVLDSCISQLLAAQELSDCRSARNATRLPNMVIANKLEK